jgi:hypothetical protein
MTSGSTPVMKPVPSFNDASSECQLAVVAGSLHGQRHASNVERSAAAGESLQRCAIVEREALALCTSPRFALLSSGVVSPHALLALAPSLR